jgi:hypothetical protein
VGAGDTVQRLPKGRRGTQGDPVGTRDDGLVRVRRAVELVGLGSLWLARSIYRAMAAQRPVSAAASGRQMTTPILERASLRFTSQGHDPLGRRTLPVLSHQPRYRPLSPRGLARLRWANRLARLFSASAALV